MAPTPRHRPRTLPSHPSTEAAPAVVTAVTAAALFAQLQTEPRIWSSEHHRALAVTIHDIEPRTFSRTREIREWLAQRRIDRVTLAVIPAADLHPIGTRAPLLAAWLRGQVARGDAIAQHGLQHRGPGSEFASLDLEESRGRVEAGLGLLREAELDPHGFIAPAYGYTPALRQVLGDRFDWFGERSQVCGRDHSLNASVLGLSTPSRVPRRLAPPIVRLSAGFCGQLMRLEIHPGDFDEARPISVIERLLARATDRQVITYDEVFCAAS
jgi:predicted deacetylase